MRVQALLARPLTTLRRTVMVLPVTRRTRPTVTPPVTLARVTGAPRSATLALRPCLLLTLPRGSPTLSATTMLRRRRMMRRLLAAPTRHLRARLWLTLNELFLTLRRA